MAPMNFNGLKGESTIGPARPPAALMQMRIPRGPGVIERPLSILLAALILLAPRAANAASLQEVTVLTGRGTVESSTTGSGPSAGVQYRYQLVEYTGDRFVLAMTNLANGAFEAYPAPIGDAGGVVAAGADGNVYVGTHPAGHLLRFDPAAKRFADLGRVGAATYVYDLAAAQDGTIYGVTYPTAELFRLRKGSNSIENLGRVGSSDQVYARSLQISGDQRALYIGLGSVRADVVQYDLATGEKHSILSPEEQVAGIARVYHAADGRLYAAVGSKTFAIDGGVARTVSPSVQTVPASGEPAGTFKGLPENAAGAAEDQNGPLANHPLRAFRLCVGPSGQVYISSILPAYLYRLDTTAGRADHVGYVGAGEIYSFATVGSTLFMGAYYGPGAAPILALDTNAPFALKKNPRLLTYPGWDGAWRPFAVTSTASAVFFGDVPPYGQLGGHLVEVDAATLAVTDLGVPVHDESVTSLASFGGLVIGGTDVIGGPGAKPTQVQAGIFYWDTASKTVTFRVAPVPGAISITDLVVHDGMLYGIASGEFFAYDLAQRNLKYAVRFSMGTPLSNSMAFGPDGALWGASNLGIFRVDPATGVQALPGPASQPLTAGFAMIGGTIYVAAKATIYRFTP